MICTYAGKRRCSKTLGQSVQCIPCISSFMGPVVLTTGYWNFRGLGAPMRMICTYAGVEWEDIKYDVRKKAKGGWVASDWEKDDKPDLQQRNPLIQLPYVINHK